MKKTGAQIIVELLTRQGVKTIAGIPGGCNLPIYHALAESPIRHVLTRHEQGAGFLAQGMARITGKAAVCMATSGPGATNLITAIADAKLDSVPLVAITGQVSCDMIGADAFQEVDTYGLTLPITKHNFLVRHASELLTVIPEAFRIAQSGRPGPVAVDVTKNAQTETCEFTAWPEPGEADGNPECPRETLERMAARINEAKRPILYAGGGVCASGAAGLLRAVAEKASIPVVNTLMAMGCLPHGHPLNLGLLGMHGARHVNLAMEEADLIVALGARFDDRAIGKAAAFCPGADIIHVDIDRSELDKIMPGSISAAADAALTLAALLPLIKEDKRLAWNARLAAIRAENPVQYPNQLDMREPISVIRRIGALMPEDAIIATDVGQHQMWTAQVYPFARPGSFLTSGGLGTMGFGLPAAIGAALAAPSRPVICISGDGSIQMNIQELATLAETHANVKVVILNNGHLGLVRQQQELFYEGRYAASRFECRPDFAALARGYGLPGFDLGTSSDPEKILKAALTTPGPCIINAPIHPEVNVYPMVPPGAANSEMIGGKIHV